MGVPTGEMKFGIKGVAADGDAEPSAACGGCSEAEHPQRSKKSSKRAARRFFRAPQGGKDCRLAKECTAGSHAAETEI